jgi:hypothetical protein
LYTTYGTKKMAVIATLRVIQYNSVGRFVSMIFS